MGNDGGSIPTRRELVKEAARNPTATQLKETLQERLEYNWNHDPLTQRLLASPVVSDSLGRLFNKDSVLEFLLPAESEDGVEAKAEQAKYLQGTVKGLRDVVEVKFSLDQDSTTKKRRWICPITNKPLGAATKAVYIVPCGHAFSETAVKEVPDDKCLQCGESYAPNDVIPILPVDETDIARLTLRSKDLKERGLSHSLKKAGGKKRKHKDKAGEEVESTAPGRTEDAAPATKLSSSINNSSTASLTAKVMKEQEENNKKRKMAGNDNLQSLFSKADRGVKKKNNDFMNRGYAIPAHERR